MKVKATYLAVAVGIGIIAMAIFYVYSADQGRIRGKTFGDNLQIIQDEIKQEQTLFYSKKEMLDEKSITLQEFSDFAKEHTAKLNEILAKYNSLRPPESFVKSVELFKSSTQKQIESDKYFVEWITTNNTSDRVRSDELIQESFEDEMAGLASYNKAKNNAGS
ncbi:MAG: hypothetical protein ACKOCQ_05815 [Candidatus Nitrosotenuis sp.]